MFFIGMASGVVFITIFFLLIANKNKTIDKPKWIEEQFEIMKERNVLMREEHNLTLRSIIGNESLINIQRLMLNLKKRNQDAWNCGTKDCVCNKNGVCDCHNYKVPATNADEVL